MVSRIHSSDARGICRIILPESWKCNPLGMGQKGASFNLWKRKAAVKLCTDKNLLLLLVRNSPQTGYSICGRRVWRWVSPGFFVCWQIEQVRLILNSFPIKRNLDVYKQQLLWERRAESCLTNWDPEISQIYTWQRLQGLHADCGV